MQNYSTDILLQTLIAAHHPFVEGRFGRGLNQLSTWGKLYNIWKLAGHLSFDTTFQGDLKKCKDLLLSENGILNESEFHKQAAISAISAVSLYYPKIFIDSFLNSILALLRSEDLFKITNEEFIIFETPDDELSPGKLLELSSRIKKDKNIRRNKHESLPFEDEEWIAQESVNNINLQSEAEKCIALEEERKIRNDIKSRAYPVLIALEIVSSICKKSPVIVRDELLGVFFKELLILIKSKIVGTQAFTTLLSIARCTDFPISGNPLPCTQVISKIVLNKEENFDEMDNNQISKFIKRLIKFVNGPSNNMSSFDLHSNATKSTDNSHAFRSISNCYIEKQFENVSNSELTTPPMDFKTFSTSTFLFIFPVLQ